LFDGSGCELFHFVGFHISFSPAVELFFVLIGSAFCCQEKQMPFLEAGWRSAACAVNGILLARG
jgi:hypothetical protein